MMWLPAAMSHVQQVKRQSSVLLSEISQTKTEIDYRTEKLWSLAHRGQWFSYVQDYVDK